jgi:hypothetical protein
MRRSTALRLFLPAGVAVLALAAAGCGAEDHPNEPRPPKPIEVTAQVDNKRVTVSPDKFGAGLAIFTISNQSDSETSLTLEGPIEDESVPILPGNVTDTFKVAMETGDYVVGAGTDSSAAPAEVRVGPERPSSQDDLLLP